MPQNRNPSPSLLYVRQLPRDGSRRFSAGAPPVQLERRTSCWAGGSPSRTPGHACRRSTRRLRRSPQTQTGLWCGKGRILTSHPNPQIWRRGWQEGTRKRKKSASRKTIIKAVSYQSKEILLNLIFNPRETFLQKLKRVRSEPYWSREPCSFWAWEGQFPYGYRPAEQAGTERQSVLRNHEPFKCVAGEKP